MPMTDPAKPLDADTFFGQELRYLADWKIGYAPPSMQCRLARALIAVTRERDEALGEVNRWVTKVAPEMDDALKAAEREVAELRVYVSKLKDDVQTVCALYDQDCTGLRDSRVGLIQERNR